MNAHSIGYGIFGTPRGFQSRTSGILSNVKLNEIADLDSMEIMVVEGTELLGIIKEQKGQDIITHFLLYRFAREIDTNRQGTFYGAIVSLKNNAACPEAIYSLLVELVTNVKLYLTENTSQFISTFAKISFRKPDNLKLIKKTLEPIVNQSGNQGEIGFVKLSSIKNQRFALFHEVISNNDLSPFKKLYASENREILTIVKERNQLASFTLDTDYSSITDNLILVNSKLKKQKSILTKDISVLATEKEELKKENLKLSEENQKISVVQDRYDKLLENSRKLKTGETELQEKIASLSKSVIQLEEKKEEVEDNLNTKKQTSINLKNKILKLESQLGKLKIGKSELLDEENKINLIKKEIAELDIIKEKLSREIRESKIQLKEIVAEKKVQKRRNIELLQKKNFNEKKAQKVKKVVQILEGDKNELKNSEARIVGKKQNIEEENHKELISRKKKSKESIFPTIKKLIFPVGGIIAVGLMVFFFIKENQSSNNNLTEEDLSSFESNETKENQSSDEEIASLETTLSGSPESKLESTPAIILENDLQMDNLTPKSGDAIAGKDKQIITLDINPEKSIGGHDLTSEKLLTDVKEYLGSIEHNYYDKQLEEHIEKMRVLGLKNEDLYQQAEELYGNWRGLGYPRSKIQAIVLEASRKEGLEKLLDEFFEKYSNRIDPEFSRKTCEKWIKHINPGYVNNNSGEIGKSKASILIYFPLK